MDFNPAALPPEPATSAPASTPAAPDPAAQLAALRQQRIDGKIGDKVYFAKMEALAPLIGTGKQAPTPTSQDQAVAKLDQLRQQRLAGKITEREYFAQMEQIGPGSGDPSAQLSPDAQADFDRAMAPPADPASYRFTYPPDHAATPEALAWDTEVRATCHKLGLPQLIAEPLIASADRLTARFAKASETEIRQHCEAIGGQLRQRWGQQYDTKIAAIDTIIDSLDGKVADAVRGMPWLLADVGVMTSLDHFAQHRSRKTL